MTSTSPGFDPGLVMSWGPVARKRALLRRLERFGVRGDLRLRRLLVAGIVALCGSHLAWLSILFGAVRQAEARLPGAHDLVTVHVGEGCADEACHERRCCVARVLDGQADVLRDRRGVHAEPDADRSLHERRC